MGATQSRPTGPQGTGYIYAVNRDRRDKSRPYLRRGSLRQHRRQDCTRCQRVGPVTARTPACESRYAQALYKSRNGTSTWLSLTAPWREIESGSTSEDDLKAFLGTPTATYDTDLRYRTPGPTAEQTPNITFPSADTALWKIEFDYIPHLPIYVVSGPEGFR